MRSAAINFTAPPIDETASQVLNPYPNTSARRVRLAVTWQSKASARDLGPHLDTLSYTDNLSGAADDLSLGLEDRDGLWSGDWRPELGDHVRVRIDTDHGWFGSAPAKSLNLGLYSHDKISLQGPPRRAALQCVSAPLATGLRRRKRTHSWRGVSLKRIAQDIANRAQMRLDFQAEEGPKYKQAVQNDKSDLEFLEEQCKEVGTTLKITESTIVIYDERTLDAGDAVGDISLTGGKVIAWDFDHDDSGRYGSCHVSCFDPRTGKTWKYQFPPAGTAVDGLDPNGQTLELVIPVSDVGEAATRAQALLRNANRFATSGKISTLGDPGLVAGVVFNLVDAFGFDGKFIVTKASHHIGGGYRCDLEVRRCLEGY